MTKKLAKSDVNVQSIEQMVDQMEARLSLAWHELEGKPEVQAAVVAVWEQVKQMQNVSMDLTAMLHGAKAAVDEATLQRNRALFELKALEKHGVEMSQKRFAGLIAVAMGLNLPDVERVLAVMAGDKTTFEEPTLEEFKDVFIDLANRLYAEEKFDEFSEDD